MQLFALIGRAAVLALCCSWSVMAASHSVVLLPAQVSEWDSPTLTLRWVDSLAVSGITPDGELKTQWMKRGGRGFSPSTSGEGLSLKSVPSFSGSNNYRLLGSHADLNSVYHLTEGLLCSDDGTSCLHSVYVLSTHTDQGGLHDAKTATPLIVLPENGCGSAPSLWPWDQGVVVFDGCSALHHFDTKLSIKSTKTLPASFGGERWAVSRTPSYDLTDPSGAKPMVSTIFAGRFSQGEWQQFRLQSDKMEPEWLAPFPVDTSMKRCEWLSVSPSRIVCEDNNAALFMLDGSAQGAQPLLDPLSPTDPKERTLLTHDWAVFSQGQHAFVLRAQTITDPQPQPSDPAAPAVPPLFSEGLRFSNVRIQNGARYQVFPHQGENKDLPFHVVSVYQRDPGHYYAAALLRQSERLSLSIQDHITQDQAPRWLQSVGITMGSGTEQVLSLLYDDDNHLPEELLLNTGALPSWAQLSDGFPKQLNISPSHADTGMFNWLLSIAQPDDLSKKAELTTDIQVLLSPYQLTLFEAELFKKMGIDSPVGLSSLLNAVGGRLRVLENEALAFHFGVDGRSSGDVKVVVENAPSFLQWNPQGAQLSGTPDQVNVGRHPGMILRMQDRYAPIDPQTGEPPWETLSFPLEVLQVDDPLKVVSTPSTSAQVNVPYVYELKTSDEETEQPAMDVRVGSAPSWLAFDAQTDTLRGTPSVRDVGVHRIQLMIVDDGGNVVLHSFDVNVENPEQLKESGGAGLGYTGWLLLGLVMLRRKSTKTT